MKTILMNGFSTVQFLFGAGRMDSEWGKVKCSACSSLITNSEAPFSPFNPDRSSGAAQWLADQAVVVLSSHQV